MTSWHAAAFSDSAEPTTHQALAPSAPIWLFHKIMSLRNSMFVTDAFIFSASAKAWRQRQIKVGVSVSPALQTKPDFWHAQKKGHSTETSWISLIQNLEKQSRNPRLHSALHTVWQCMTYSWIAGFWQLNSIRDERWNSTCKPSKLLTVKGCRKHYIMTCRCIQRRQPHTRPWRPRHQSGCLPNWCSWRTRLSSVPRPRPGGSDRSRLASC